MNETPQETFALLPHRLRSSAIILQSIANALRTTINRLPLGLHGDTVPQIAATAQLLDLIAKLHETHARKLIKATHEKKDGKGPQRAAKGLSEMPHKAFHHA